jgi:hypothetical protein
MSDQYFPRFARKKFTNMRLTKEYFLTIRGLSAESKNFEHEYLSGFAKKYRSISRRSLVAYKLLIHEKNQDQKISVRSRGRQIVK